MHKGHSGFDYLKAPLPLPFTELTNEELKMQTKSKFTLKVLPGKKKSVEYTKVLYHINGTEEPREILQWQNDLKTIRIGLNLNNPKTIFFFTALQCYGAAKDAYLSCILDARKQWPEQVKTWRKENLPVRPYH